ncbi:hypothetical protein BaRGS_00025420 [Batillaria attramentaria]|uniref:Uncharacterized protein n=1 Tax=Batillaria attramentaria TaxID=370345 RepID=A0ABD0K8D3_9CAEN
MVIVLQRYAITTASSVHADNIVNTNLRPTSIQLEYCNGFSPSALLTELFLRRQFLLVGSRTCRLNMDRPMFGYGLL